MKLAGIRLAALPITLLAAVPSASGAGAAPAPEVRESAVRGFAFDQQVEVPGSPEAAFDAFTLETLAWWDHHFSEDPVRLVIEPKAGGAFLEVFDGAGNGVEHAQVIYAERPMKLRFTGPLGFSGEAVAMVHTLTFEPAGEGRTRVKLAVRGTGFYEDGVPAVVDGVWKHFLNEAFAPYMAARAGGAHPYVAAVERYRRARKANDTAAAKAALAPDARMWFESKSGPGEVIDLAQGGSWGGWDDYFHSTTTTSDARIRKGELRVTVEEMNDWYRLVDRPASRHYMTYWLDGTNKITGVMVHQIPGTPKSKDRLDEFKAWARAERPGLLDTLLPNGKIDPALEKAKLWKSSLLEWREATGVPATN